MRNNIAYIIEPDNEIAGLLKVLLETHGFWAKVFSDAEAFISANCTNDATNSCLLVEAALPGIGGLGLLRLLRSQGYSSPIIVLCDVPNGEFRQRALGYGANEVVYKTSLDKFLTERIHEFIPPQVND